MQAGAAALVALAVASAGAGWYSLGGLVLGAVLAAWLARMPGQSTHVSDALRRVPDGLMALAGVTRSALFAAVFAAYLVPAHAALAAPALVVVVAAADVAGVRLDTYYRRWLTGLLLAAVVVFLTVCLTISPAPPVSSGALARPPDPGGALLAVAVSTVVFSGTCVRGASRVRRYLPIGVTAAVLVAVAAAAMYQLGPQRFGLSATSLRTVFAAADAKSLLPVLSAAVVLATVPAALLALRQARAGLAQLAPRESGRGQRARAGLALPGVLAAAALASALGPAANLLVCAAVLLARALVSTLRAVSARRPSAPG